MVYIEFTTKALCIEDLSIFSWNTFWTFIPQSGNICHKMRFTLVICDGCNFIAHFMNVLLRKATDFGDQ